MLVSFGLEVHFGIHFQVGIIVWFSYQRTSVWTGHSSPSRCFRHAALGLDLQIPLKSDRAFPNLYLPSFVLANMWSIDCTSKKLDVLLDVFFIFEYQMESRNLQFLGGWTAKEIVHL